MSRRGGGSDCDRRSNRGGPVVAVVGPPAGRRWSFTCVESGPGEWVRRPGSGCVGSVIVVTLLISASLGGGGLCLGEALEWVMWGRGGMVCVLG